MIHHHYSCFKVILAADEDIFDFKYDCSVFTLDNVYVSVYNMMLHIAARNIYASHFF